MGEHISGETEQVPQGGLYWGGIVALWSMLVTTGHSCCLLQHGKLQRALRPGREVGAFLGGGHH